MTQPEPPPHKPRLGVGLVGYGYWGAKLLRNIVESGRARLDAVADLDRSRLAKVTARFPGTATYDNYRAMLARPDLDAVIVATPAATHFAIALETLRAGRSVFVEKPLATRSEHAERLVEEAERRGLTLMVGHTFVYSGAVSRLRQLVREDALGSLCSYDSTRVNLGLFQPDVNVLWDLAVHDLSILDDVLSQHPVAVSATGATHVDGEPENLAYATLFFPDSLLAHIHVSWLAPTKIRRTHITGTKRMVVYDDMDPQTKIQVFDKGIDLSQDHRGQQVIAYRENGVEKPLCDETEPLRREVEHFFDCVETGNTPRSDGYSGLRVVSILEAASRSLKERGQLVELSGLPEGSGSPDLRAPLVAKAI